MAQLPAIARRIGAYLGNEGALANAGALRHDRQRERWTVAALERAIAHAPAPATQVTATAAAARAGDPPLRRTA